MPFRSEAQRRKLASLVEQGKFAQSAFDEWNSATGDAKLPERVSAQKSAKKKRAAPKTGRYATRGGRYG